MGRGKEKGGLVFGRGGFGGGLFGGGEENVGVEMFVGKGVSEISWRFGCHTVAGVFGVFFGLMGEGPVLRCLEGELELSIVEESVFGGGDGCGLFFGVALWGVLSTALSCRSCWTAPEEGGGKI